MLESPAIAFITTCKGRLQHLMQTLPKMVAQPGTETIVVDYDCPEHSGDWVTANFPAVRVVRVTRQPVFNLARARNLGAAAAAAPWLCFVDADTLLHPDFAASVLAVTNPAVYCQCVHGRRELAGSVVLPRAAFAQLQGYDEVIEGWGGEDRDLYHRLQHLGLRRLELPSQLLDTIRHGVDLRTRFQRLQNPMHAWLINRMYLEIKHGMLALSGEELPTGTRQKIHAEIEAEVFAAQAAGRIASYSLSEDWRKFMPGHEVERILTVRVRPGGSSAAGGSG
jgi:glycosyltransferase involved in cell wall biosynthesis